MEHYLHKGDRVKLTDKAAKTFRRSTKRMTEDWSVRRGTVVSAGPSITVKWDSRVTLDQWPLKALEKI